RGSRRGAGARDRGKSSAPFADSAALRALRRDASARLRGHEPRYAASDGATRHGPLVPAGTLRAFGDPRVGRARGDSGDRGRLVARACARMAARIAFAGALSRAGDADAPDTSRAAF